MIFVSMNGRSGDGTARTGQQFVPTFALSRLLVNQLFSDEDRFALWPTEQFLGKIEQFLFGCSRRLKRSATGHPSPPAAADAGIERNA